MIFSSPNSEVAINILINIMFTEVAQEAINLEEQCPEVTTKPPVGEICLLSSPSIIVSLEMDIGNETIPVLVMQASLSGQVKDWSSDVSFIIYLSAHRRPLLERPPPSLVTIIGPALLTTDPSEPQ